MYIIVRSLLLYWFFVCFSYYMLHTYFDFFICFAFQTKNHIEMLQLLLVVQQTYIDDAF